MLSSLEGNHIATDLIQFVLGSQVITYKKHLLSVAQGQIACNRFELFNYSHL